MVELGITGKKKADIVADVFGQQIGTIYESGLIDANDEKSFDAMLESLKERWSNFDEKGGQFYEWFCKQKRSSFLQSAIAPVRQRAGLGFPPEKFTTNRSEQTNRSIQEFVKKECNVMKKVDEFSFCVALNKLVKMQQQEIEMAIVGKGEYRIRDKFQELNVLPEKWNKMNEKQKEIAVEKIHSITIKESVSNISVINKTVNDGENPLCAEMVDAGIDWIPRTILTALVEKAAKLSKTPGALVQQSLDTIVVASNSDPRKPHIVNFFANGRSECNNCPGFTSQSVCAHVVAACIKTDRTKQFLRWLVCSKRTKGSTNLSKAVTFGMPKGRGRKGEKAPRKKGKGKKQSPLTVVPRIVPSPNFPRMDVEELSPSSYHHQQSTIQREIVSASSRSVNYLQPLNAMLQVTPASHTSTASLQQPVSLQRPPSLLLQATSQITYSQSPRLSQQHPTQTLQQPASSQRTPSLQFQSTTQSTPFQSRTLLQQRPTSSLQQPITSLQLQPATYQIPVSCRQPQCPSFPRPTYGQFLIYLLQFCPGQTSTCFGCGQPLKDGDQIRIAPNDIVIVSKMVREFCYNGTPQSKLGNVYFHCDISCVRRKHPNFQASCCIIPPSIRPHLFNVHMNHLQNIPGQ